MIHGNETIATQKKKIFNGNEYLAGEYDLTKKDGRSNDNLAWA